MENISDLGYFGWWIDGGYIIFCVQNR